MIAVDWGSSNLRAYRLNGDGVILEHRNSNRGVLSCDGHFETELARHIEGWNDDCLVLCGMIGSRGGWIEVPYVECPGGEGEIAAGLLRIATRSGAFGRRALWIVPGMIDRSSSPVADVMRGEESQVIGALDQLDDSGHCICLPGTHSKWVQVRDGRVAAIRTAMTGESYALFRNQSVLARLMSKEEPSFDTAAFEAGLHRSGDPGGLLHHLFGVRTMGLTGQLSERQSPSYLSGLLIGHEIREQTPHPTCVHLIGNARLQASYAHALAVFGIEVRRHSEELAAVGLHRLAVAAGL
jgi:2-dehydro-3-deoxygalactonokinase